MFPTQSKFFINKLFIIIGKCFCLSCHTSSSLSDAVSRILPNYLATYVAIATVMIANPCLYRCSTRDMERIITTSSGQFTSRERDIMDAIKMKFSIINVVFYICWIPNLLNGILLWTLWFHLPATWIISIWYIMVRPNCTLSLKNPLYCIHHYYFNNNDFNLFSNSS